MFLCSIEKVPKIIILAYVKTTFVCQHKKYGCENIIIILVSMKLKSYKGKFVTNFIVNIPRITNV